LFTRRNDRIYLIKFGRGGDSGRVKTLKPSSSAAVKQRTRNNRNFRSVFNIDTNRDGWFGGRVGGGTRSAGIYVLKTIGTISSGTTAVHYLSPLNHRPLHFRTRVFFTHKRRLVDAATEMISENPNDGRFVGCDAFFSSLPSSPPHVTVNGTTSINANLNPGRFLQRRGISANRRYEHLRFRVAACIHRVPFVSISGDRSSWPSCETIAAYGKKSGLINTLRFATGGGQLLGENWT